MFSNLANEAPPCNEWWLYIQPARPIRSLSRWRPTFALGLVRSPRRSPNPFAATWLESSWGFQLPRPFHNGYGLFQTTNHLSSKNKNDVGKNIPKLPNVKKMHNFGNEVPKFPVPNFCPRILFPHVLFAVCVFLHHLRPWQDQWRTHSEMVSSWLTILQSWP